MTSETLQAGYTSYSLSGKAVEVDAPKATKTEIVFIDTGVGDYQALVDGFRPGVELVLVDDTQDGLTQMARALEGRSGVDAVHVIGHGAEGLLALGSARIALENLGGYADAFATIRNALSPDADLLLYGCDVGKGEVGRAFVTALAQMSGADVAASDDPTGASSLGADGVLEVVNGSIEAAPAVMEAWNSYSATLAVSSYQAVTAPVPDFAPASPFGLYALGDFDGDGDQDMLRQTSVGGAGEFYENQNGTFVLSTRVQWPALSTLNLAQGKFADFDNDGDLDFYQQVGGADNDIYLQLPGSPPAIVATNLGGSGNPLSPGADIILTFSEAVFSGGGNIYIRDSATNAVIATVATNSSLVTGGGSSTITINPASNLPAGTDLYITFDKNAFVDADGMIFGALDFGSLTRVAQTDPGFLKFTTAAPDTQAPLIVNVAIPNVPMKIGDIVTATITVAADSDSLMLGAGSKIGGYTLGNLHKVNATTYTATFIITEGSADVAAGADLPVNVVLVDSADNISPPYTAAIAQASDAIDATVPTVSVAADKFVLKAGETATIIFTFSEDPGSSFTSGSVAVSGGTLSAISGTGLTRTATFTPTTNVNNGTASISVINKSYSDVAGNGGAASLGISLTYDTLRPTLTIVCNKPSLKAGDTATITFTFSEDPGSSFGWDGSTGDLTVSGGTLSAISGTGTTRTATFTPAANTNGGMASISVQGSTYQDAKGNTGASASLSFGFDTQAPNAPSAPELAAEDDSGTFNDDNVTNSNTATFSGTAENGTTVRLYDGATEIAHTTVTNGTYWITLTGLSEGNHTFAAVAIDADGNASAASAGLAVTIDRTPSSTMVLSASLSDDTGESDADMVTSGAAQTISGTLSAILEYGERVEVSLDNGDHWLVADVDGQNWSLETVLSGSNTLQVRVVDRAGNAGTSFTQTYTLDTVAPAAPSVPNLEPGSDTGNVDDDNITGDTTPTFTGTAEDGTTVRLYIGNTEIGQGVAVNGTWRITSSTLGAGSHSITARATDAAGNDGPASASLQIEVLTDAPATKIKSLTFSADTGLSANDLITRVVAQTISGTLDAYLKAGEYVEVSVDGGKTWLRAASNIDSWSIATTLIAGEEAVSARVVNAIGNSGDVYTRSYHLDNLAPGVTITSNVDKLKQGETATITFTFTEDPGDTFTWNGVVGDVVVSGGILSAISGSGTTRTATFTPNASLEGSASITVHGSGYADLAGNYGTNGTTPQLLIDTEAPETPGAPALANASDTGPSNSDGLTANSRPTFTGTAASGATIILYNGTTEIGRGTAVNGAWSIVPAAALSEGMHTISARVVDDAGNESAAAVGQDVTIDTVAPTLAITSSVDRVKIGESATITFTFSEDPGATFTMADINVEGGTLSALSGTGRTRTAVFTPEAGVADGVASITVDGGAYADGAGNLGGAGASPALTFNTATPDPIDGVPVDRTEIVNADGSVSQVVTIPVVTSGRSETDGAAGYADIPLVSGGGRPLLLAQVPVGYGLQASGPSAPKTAGTSLADLIRAIQAHTPAGSFDQSQLTGGGSGFLEGLFASTPLLVQTIVPVVAPGSLMSPRQPLVISGSPDPTAPATALVIDGAGLPSGVQIQLDNVSFAAIIGSMTLTGGAGSQTVYADGASQHMVLGADDDELHGGGGDDYVGSHGGNDQLYGDDGNDTVSGGIGDDALWGGSGNDRLLGGSGKDRLDGGSGHDRLYGDSNNDTVVGGAGNDNLWGGTGVDRLEGGSGNDSLKGDAGNDWLAGGLGRDKLWGGSGRDVFDFNSLQESKVGAQRDVIYDFRSGQDRIDLRGIDANESRKGNQAFSWTGSDGPFLHPKESATFLKAGFTGEAGQLRFAGGVLMGDADGDGKADFQIKIVGRISAGDVIL